ncbi:MAG: MoxR family ATPase [Pseudomonadota bacterium]
MTINAISVSAGKALAVLRDGWAMQRDAGQRFSWMLHGRPGVGKTQIAEALARHIGGRLYDVRLTQIDTADLRGLPYYDHETRRTQWYRPEDLPDDDAPAVLFLDEITAASPLLQPTVYGLLQERRVGLHGIPDQVMILAAGNTVEDGAVAYEMGTALSDRLIHMVVQAEAEDWLQHVAVARGLHPTVIGFIKSRPDMLETLEASLRAEHMIAATPRSWERVSHIMTYVSDRETRMVMIAGTIGTAVAADFLRAAEDIEATVNVEKLVKTARSKRARLYPESLHGLNALTYGLVGYLTPKTLDPVVDCVLDIAELQSLKPKAKKLEALPLRELATAGFEMVIDKALREGMAERLIAHPAYVAHQSRRAAQGLT